jgi:poly-beta-1,6-N-acetyl-D-glucosamine synthase
MGQIIALIPAHNEAESITGTLRAMLSQSVRIHRIIVIPNNCTDNTPEVASSVPGVEVMEFPGYNSQNKAGALNWAIKTLLPECDDTDFFMVTDADSILDPHFVDAALTALRRDDVGAVCASFYGQHHPGFLSLLQRNEYTRFARQISRKQERAQVLSGVGSMFPVRLIREVMRARRDGRLPGKGDEFYHAWTATEDIELTFAIKKLGYTPLAPDRCRALTDTMPTFRKLYDQRIRWQRGMLDSIYLYGWSGPRQSRLAP